MKRLIQGSLFFLVLSGMVVPTVKAETAMSVSAKSLIASSFVNQETTPVNLIGLAYRGFFTKDGIPSNGALISAYRTGKVSAKDIVQSAVNGNRLP